MDQGIASGRNRWEFWTGLSILGLVIVLSVGAPLMTSVDPDAQDLPEQKRYLSPTVLHPFGCDQFGRDVFARVLYGGRISLMIAGVIVVLSATIGIGVGMISGFLGGPVDTVLMRVLDAFLAFPVMFLSVTCLALFGSGTITMILILVFTGWMDIARLARSEILSLRRRPFAIRARAAGLGLARVTLRHLLPNLMPTLLVAMILRMSDIILLESALSFLGLGVDPPTATWGGIISDGRMVLSSAWWMTFFPGLAIVMTTGGLHLISEGLRVRA